MARPKKLNADYFSHDADMRNDPRIRAVRRKFSHTGYAVWNYLLETITDSDLFEVEWSIINIEILAGDFDVEPDQLVEITDYCIKMGLLQKLKHNNKNAEPFLTCEKLKERFSELLNKRERNAKKGVPVAETDPKGEFQPQKLPENEVSAVQNPQSKVKESKVKESKVNLSTKEEKEGTDGGDAALPPPFVENSIDGLAGQGIKAESTDHEEAPLVAAVPPSESTDPEIPPVKIPPAERKMSERMQSVVDYFNEKCTCLPKVRELTETRKNTIKVRLEGNEGNKRLIEVIRKAAASDFLNGINDRGWKANFDWIIKKENYTRILEGTYDNDQYQQSDDNRTNRATSRLDIATPRGGYGLPKL